MKNDKEQPAGDDGMVAIFHAEYEEYEKQRVQMAALEQQVALLTKALRLLRQKRFGISS